MNTRHLFAPFIVVFSLVSCSPSDPSNEPTIVTPDNAQVDLSMVSMKISNAKFTFNKLDVCQLTLDYTLRNQAGATLSFTSIFSGKDELIEVNLSDQLGDPLYLGKRPLEGLTLAEPRPMLIPKGKSTRSYKVPLQQEFRKKGEPITVRVRFHAPSRYDELRSSVEAPLIMIPWPKSTEIEPPSEDNSLTLPLHDATPLPQRQSTVNQSLD